MGLTYPQYLVMLVLWENDKLTITDLGERLLLDSGTLTPLLKRLESSNLLSRTRDRDDERKTRVTLTTRGRQLRQRALQVPELAAAATGCELSELERLTVQITRLRNGMAARDESG